MPKVFPKSYGKRSKMEPMAPRIDLFWVFILGFYRFLEKAKNLIFRWGSGPTQKQEKSTRGGPKAQKILPINNEWTDRSPVGSRLSRLGIK